MELVDLGSPAPARLQGVPGALPARIDLQAGDGLRGAGERLGTGQDVAEPPRPEPAAVIQHAAELRQRDLPRRHHDGHDGTGVRAIVQRHVRTDRSSPRRRTALGGGASLRVLPDPPAERGHVRGADDPVHPAVEQRAVPGVVLLQREPAEGGPVRGRARQRQAEPSAARAGIGGDRQRRTAVRAEVGDGGA